MGIDMGMGTLSAVDDILNRSTDEDEEEDEGDEGADRLSISKMMTKQQHHQVIQVLNLIVCFLLIRNRNQYRKPHVRC